MSTTTMGTSDYFYVFSCFFTAVLMASSTWFFFVDLIVPVFVDFIGSEVVNWPLLMLTLVFPLLYLIVSIPNPIMFFTAAFYWFMFPFSAITLPLYSFLHLDDFSWGNR